MKTFNNTFNIIYKVSKFITAIAIGLFGLAMAFFPEILTPLRIFLVGLVLFSYSAQDILSLFNINDIVEEFEPGESKPIGEMTDKEYSNKYFEN